MSKCIPSLVYAGNIAKLGNLGLQKTIFPITAPRAVLPAVACSLLPALFGAVDISIVIGICIVPGHINGRTMGDFSRGLTPYMQNINYWPHFIRYGHLA